MPDTETSPPPVLVAEWAWYPQYESNAIQVCERAPLPDYASAGMVAYGAPIARVAYREDAEAVAALLVAAPQYHALARLAVADYAALADEPPVAVVDFARGLVERLRTLVEGVEQPPRRAADAGHRYGTEERGG